MFTMLITVVIAGLSIYGMIRLYECRMDEIMGSRSDNTFMTPQERQKNWNDIMHTRDSMELELDVCEMERMDPDAFERQIAKELDDSSDA